ncbi:hypothetical protein HMPREF3232_00132 [Fannyhessea vaginae]|nr:hypothetical protein HMPREF3232_00132 [Fannyhessea vaginae]
MYFYTALLHSNNKVYQAPHVFSILIFSHYPAPYVAHNRQESPQI